jgi:hypothetical protein
VDGEVNTGPAVGDKHFLKVYSAAGFNNLFAPGPPEEAWNENRDFRTLEVSDELPRYKSPFENLDLAIGDKDLTVRRHPDGRFEAVIAIHNRGNMASPGFRVMFCYVGPGKEEKQLHNFHRGGGYHRAGPIMPGAVWREGSGPVALPQGVSEIVVIIDPDNAVEEADEKNNRASKIIGPAPETTKAGAVPDKSPEGMQTGPAKDVDVAIEDSDLTLIRLPGGLIRPVIAIHNRGTEDSPSFKVLFYAGDPEEGGRRLHRDIIYHSAGPIEPGGVWRETTRPVAPGQGIEEIVVVIDPENTVQETDETNNRASVAIEEAQNLVQRRLQRKFGNFDFQHNPLDSAVDVLSRMIEVDIRIDPSADARAIISVELQGPTAATVLDALTGQLGLKWAVVDDTYVYISDEAGIRRALSDSNDSKVVKAVKGVDMVIDQNDLTVRRMSDGLLVFVIVIHNRGTQKSPPFKVLFYAGDPDKGAGLLDGTQHSAEPIMPGGVCRVWTIPVAPGEKTSEIFVAIDPDNEVAEADETNNRTSVAIEKALVIASLQETVGDIDYSGHLSQIPAFMRRTAAVDVRIDPTVHWQSTFSVRLDRATMAGFLDSVTSQLGLKWIIARDAEQVYVYISDAAGMEKIQSADRQSTGGDQGAVDIWITGKDIHTFVAERTGRHIVARIHSTGVGRIPLVEVRFFIGDPAKGGRRLGQGGLAMDAGTVAAEAILRELEPGEYEIFAVLDPDNRIAETDETNNRASATIKID